MTALRFRITLTGNQNFQEPRILTADTNRASRTASARAFVHSLNILVKYVRLYGFGHKRTEGQFEITWNELQQGLPKGTDGGFLLGVSEHTLLLDGIALETGQAERSFAQLLTTAGLASIHFSNQVTVDDFARLVRAFAMGGSKAQDVVKQIKDTFGDNKKATIRINEVRFVAADPGTGDITIAAQIAAQTLGPEFKQWLNDPQKLLQLIAAAEGAHSGGGGEAGGAPARVLDLDRERAVDLAVVGHDAELQVRLAAGHRVELAVGVGGARDGHQGRKYRAREGSHDHPPTRENARRSA